jgi:hypothetical protein
VNFASTSAAISAQTWQHVAFVASGSTLTFYINGNAYDSISIGSAGMSGTASSLTVGNGPDNAYLNGRISAVSVYNRPLSSIEMAKNFNALRGRYGL